MMRMLLAIGSLLVLTAVASAHAPAGTSIHEGLLHPLSAGSHLLAMIAVGLWAAQSGGRATWAWPLCFVTIMTCGSLLAVSDISVPFVEPGILTSILVLGLMITFAAKLHVAAGASLIAVFALLHGYMHGVMLAADIEALRFLVGLSLATASLHLAGITVVALCKRLAAPWATQALGALTLFAGFSLLFTHA